MRIYINDDEYLSVTEHDGKMQGIPSISTNKYTNQNCINLTNSNNAKCVCKFCFVDKTNKQYKTLQPALQNNSDILTSRLLTKKEINNITVFKNVLYVRFESFGDLNNVIQLENYINIAKHFKNTTFTLWTKHFSILIKYFKSGKKLPKNFNLVLSSPVINQGLNLKLVEIIKNYHKNTITFDVVSDKLDPKINCGTKKCIDCLNCYKKGKRQNVTELLK